MTRLTALMALAVLLTAALPGCNAEQFGQLTAQTTLVRDDVAALRGEIAAARERAATARAQAETQPAGPAREALIAAADKAEAIAGRAEPTLRETEETLGRLEARLRAADPSDRFAAAQAVLEAAAPMVPGYGPLIAFLGGTILGLVRAGYNRAAARSIARSIELTQSPEGAINLDDPSTQDDLRAHQGAAGSRIVNEAQGKALALPF